MAKVQVSAGMLKKLTDFFDDYSDDKVKCKRVSTSGIKAIYEVETEMNSAEAAAYMKSVFKKQPGASMLYFSIVEEGAY